MITRYLILCAFIVATVLLQPARAVIETYQFETEEQRLRYQRFAEELRCPKCQNQNLSGSNSPIAADLRRELHRLRVEGKSDREIVDYMGSRYGEFVLYRPPVNKQTAVLWLFPVALLLVAAIIILLLVRRRSSVAEVDGAAVHRRAEDVLARYSEEEGK